MVSEPVKSTRIFCPAVFISRFATLFGDRTVHIDHFPIEITLSVVAHLRSLDAEVFHLDIELMECTGLSRTRAFCGRLVLVFQACT